MIKIKTLTIGQLATNCYLVANKKQECLIIDPGDSPEYITEEISNYNLKPKLIIATHGHFDHVLAGYALQETFKILFAMNPRDTFILKYMQKSAKYWLNLKNEPLDPAPKITKSLKDKDKIKLGKNSFEIINTPGHTPGSICLYNQKENLIFTGDTLFQNGWGRTDLPGGSQKEMKNSLKKLLKLPSKTKVFPGHGESTTIDQERKNLKNSNPTYQTKE